jgi:hypothetical protein
MLNAIGQPPLFRKITDYGTYLRPPWLRRLSYRVQHRMRRYAADPLYLRKSYVNAVVPHGVQVTPKLFRLERVVDPDQLSRILSLEYLAQQFGGRVRDDCESPASRIY